MALPAFVASAVESWAAFYGDHQMVSVTVRYLHLAGLLVGGGTALAADRQILRATRYGSEARSGVVAALDASHRVVVPSLARGRRDRPPDGRLGHRHLPQLPALLVEDGPGGACCCSTASASSPPSVQSSGERPKAWQWLGLVSAASLGLWLTILFFGVWLTAAA